MLLKKCYQCQVLYLGASVDALPSESAWMRSAETAESLETPGTPETGCTPETPATAETPPATAETPATAEAPGAVVLPGYLHSAVVQYIFPPLYLGKGRNLNTWMDGNNQSSIH